MTDDASPSRSSREVILIIDDDDEFTTYIKDEIEHQFPDHLVLLCHTTAEARRLLERMERRVAAAVFDSGFGKSKLAGCELFRELTNTRPWLRRCSVFHTAFDEEVHMELVTTGELSESLLIGKSIDSLTSLNSSLNRILG